MKLAVFNLVCAAMTGCIPAMGELSDPCGGAACQSIVEVQFDVGSRSPLKSAISPEEDAVSNLNIYVYSGGNLVAAEYYEEDFNPSMKLLFGETYNMYALANVGLFEAPIDEGVFREYCQCRISRIHDMRELIPMAWIAEDFTVGSPSQRVRVDLERLVAKLVFSVDKSALKGLEINYARLCQSPRVVWPFRYPEGSRVETYDDVFDCDYASRNDLEALNAGEQVSFYMLENCQGRILDGNTDPWAKVPENIPGKESLCTYLEVGGMFKTGFFYQGSVTYRLYLGQDSVSDFDIRRNTLMNASLYLTDDAFDKISWRIDSSVSISDGYVGGWISNGRHAVDDLYVGERFVYTVVLADEMINHLDGNYKDAHLCVLDSSGNKSEFIEFSGLNEVESEAGANMYEVQGLCLQPGSGVIVLVDGNGELLVELESCNIQKPLLRATETIPIEDDDKIAADVAQLVLPINSEGITFYLYFVDKEGYNLNASRGCGFEISLFDLDVNTGVLDEYLSSTLDFQVVSGEGFDDGRAATFHARCVNDGKDKKVNESLIKYVTKVGECEFDICETNYDLKSLHAFSLDYLPITLSLVDNGWAGYDDCQLSIVVDNPSLLPINVTCWQLNQAGGSYNAVTRNEIVDLYGQEFTRRRYNYVCKDFSPGEMPFYCSGTSFVAGENGAYPMPE